MKTALKLIALCALSISAASCSKSIAEQMKMAENVKVTCNPEVLALKGGLIPADLTVSYPAKYFNKKATMEVLPVLVYEGGEQVARALNYQGEKVKDNYKVVAYDGGVVKEHIAFNYVEGVEKSRLELRPTIYYKARKFELPAVKVADGVNTTVLWAETNGQYTVKEDGYQAVLHESAEGQLMYDYNSSDVKKSELRSQSVRELQAALEEIASDPRYTVTGTRVVAYASPEGGQSYNAKLSDKRAASAQKAWDKVTNGMKTDKLEVQSMGQDWEGFQEAVRNSNIADKDLILRVLSMYSDPAVRESEIRNMSNIYSEINKNVFPELRRARFIADLDYQNFSDAELEELAAKAIDVLDEPALLRVATNAKTADRKAELYKLAVRKFNSQKANFNLAALALDKQDTAEAGKYLAALSESDPDVVNAKGVIELQKGNLEEAVKLFKKANTADAKVNLGTIDLLKGDYAAAASQLAGTGHHNETVALILNNQLDKAAATITCNCGRSNYLKAIIAARQGKSADVKAALEKVASFGEAFKSKADKDVEFANYR